ncbi:MAG TPA: DHH family phosphoesterase [Candidatus Nanoarchaeia archaeon]|nr:DHH family phosphoesterase [Candidatus Nanoarchaeia archaeon]
MEKRGSLENQIKLTAEKFLDLTKDKEICIISHFDTDGITSATIMIKTLKRLDKTFNVEIIKSLEKGFIENLPKDKIILFLDLASGSLEYIEKSGLKNVFIMDHHEIPINQKIPENVYIINPELHDKQKISSSGVAYLFCKEIFPDIKEIAKLAILGMIGDTLEKEIDRLNHNILNDADIKRKRGLLIYPSTRPLNRSLEFCSNLYIPGVTGDIKGVLELLRGINLTPQNGKYKSLIELTEEEMTNLVTAIMLRNPQSKNNRIIGDIFLIKSYNKLEDARELSAMINACSRLGKPEIALQFCMEIPKEKKKAEEIHIKYKQLILAGLKYTTETQKIEGRGFLIINAKDNIKDTMIGTIASIISSSNLYEEGTIIIAMALDGTGEKIKISARSVGNATRNVREILSRVIGIIGGDVGGHENAAGCIIRKNQEEEFIELLKKNLEIEMIKI